MADSPETAIVKAVVTALDVIAAGNTELGWTYVRTPTVSRAVTWDESLIQLGKETVFVVVPNTPMITESEGAGLHLRNRLSLVLVMAAEQRTGQYFENWADRMDAALEMFEDARRRLISSITDKTGELKALNVSNVELPSLEIAPKIAASASTQLAFTELLLTYDVNYAP